MDTHAVVASLGLDATNCVVVGSGIMGVLGLRPSKDVDCMVTPEAYVFLRGRDDFRTKTVYGREMLESIDGLVEVGVDWNVGPIRWTHASVLGYTLVLGGVRYLTLDFLAYVKRTWIEIGEGRPKDVTDLTLIAEYQRGA